MEMLKNAVHREGAGVGKFTNWRFITSSQSIWQLTFFYSDFLALLRSSFLIALRQKAL